MAFTTTQTIDSVLLRGLNFRTPANAAISSQYTLYATGSGQTYWSNSITPNNISTLSTTLSLYNSTLTNNLSNYNSTTTGNLNLQSTSIAGLGNAFVSTTAGLIFVDGTLSNADFLLGLQIQQLSTQTAKNISSLWFSTQKLVTSTLLSISSISTYFTQINAVQSSVNANYSTLSTFIGKQNTSTYNSLTSNYIAADTVLWNSTLATVGRQLSSLSSVVAYQTTVTTLSTVLTNQLLSSIAGTFVYINRQDGIIMSTISTLFMSSLIPLQSTVGGLNTSVNTLNALSTNLSTISYQWISSFVSTSQYYQDVYTFVAIGKVSSSVSTLQQSTNYLLNSYSTLSTLYSRNVSTVSTQYTRLNSTVIGLQYELNVLTTSSILAGIYDEFVDLENYTSSIIGNNYANGVLYLSSVQYSTQVQNTSTSDGYFNYYVSTLYASTLSTLIPSTFALTSSMVSTLYSTSFVYLTSTLTSSLTKNFNSTISSITVLYISSVNTSINSTVLGYLSTPGGQLISTISTLDYIALSTFTSTSAGQLAGESTLFYSSFLSWQSSVNCLSTTANNLIYLQSSFYQSTLYAYPSTLTWAINSTNASVYAYTTVEATQTLSNIENSTNTAYTHFLDGLAAGYSTVAYSTLYTSIDINLTGSNYVATMDLATYRNFNINVYNINNGQSNYLLNYYSNAISALNYRAGIININVSTVGNAYDNNNKQLRLDVYRWGLPTTVWGSGYPYISSAAYTIQYQYNIINSVVYTNLLNVYPQLAIQNPMISPTTGRNVYIVQTASWSLSNFWRGSPIQVNWTNYSFFPYGELGAPPFNPDVLVDVVVGGTTLATYGPFPLSQSTATVYAPYLTQQLVPVVPTNINIYIVGLQTQLATTSFNTIIPGFDDIFLQPYNYPNAGENIHWIGGQELVGVTDSSNYPLYGLTPVVTPAVGSPFLSYNNDPLYIPANLLDGPYNTFGANLSISTVMINNVLAGANWVFDDSVTSGIGYLTMYISLINNFITTLAAVTAQGLTARFTISNFTDNNFASFTPTITFDSVYGGNPLYKLNVVNCPLTNNIFANIGSHCYLDVNLRQYFFTDTGGADNQGNPGGGNPLDSGLHTVDYTAGPGYGWYNDNSGYPDVPGSWYSGWGTQGTSGLYPYLVDAINAISYRNAGIINATFNAIVWVYNSINYPTANFLFYLSDNTYILVVIDQANNFTVRYSDDYGYILYTLAIPGENFYTIQVERTSKSLTFYLIQDEGQYLYPNTTLPINFKTSATSFGSSLYTYTIPGSQTFVDRLQLIVGTSPDWASYTYKNIVAGFYVYNSDIPTMLSNINYIPSTFVGPYGSPGADEQASADIPSALTINASNAAAPIDAISSLTYYNLNSALGNVPGGIDSNSAASMTVIGSLSYNGLTYQSTFSTTTALTQTFRF